MKTSLHLPENGLTGHFTKSLDYITADGIETAINHYSVVLELGGGWNKRLSLYRNFDGQWMEDLVEQDGLLRHQLKLQIEKAERNTLWPI
jgi:hypothetical protein